MKVINFLKTKNIIKISPGETLSQALSKLSSSHDAAFVFDKNNKFIGVINPYHSLIKTSYPANAKVEHCLFHPPKIKVSYPLAKVAQLMIESKVHYLPVFDDQEKFTGIVSARNILTHLHETHAFRMKIGEFIKSKNQPVLTVMEDDQMATALSLFKTRKVSKLVVINKDMKLRGILTYYDLINVLLTPKTREERGDRVGNRVSLTYQRVKNFFKTYVLTLNMSGTLKDALDLIIEKSIGSVVIVDREKHPIGIITTRDYLTLIARGRSYGQLEVIGRNLSKESKNIVNSFFLQIAGWVRKVPDLARAQLIVKEGKNGGLFEAVLSLIPQKGKMTVIKEEGKNLKNVLIKIKKK